MYVYIYICIYIYVILYISIYRHVMNYMYTYIHIHYTCDDCVCVWSDMVGVFAFRRVGSVRCRTISGRTGVLLGGLVVMGVPSMEFSQMEVTL